MSSVFNSAEDLDETLGPFWLTTPPTQPNHGPSPATSLPPRTLEKIFLYACNTFVLESQAPSLWIDQVRDVGTAPVILSHVCTRWRNIANTTPRLWRNVVVRLSSQNPKYAGVFLEDFLLKSDPYTINICFLVYGGLAFPSFPNAENCLPPGHGLHPTVYNEGSVQAVYMAVKFSKRWERASFFGSMLGYEDLFVHLCVPLYLPNLSCLEIHNHESAKLDQEPRSLFQHAYALRSLRIISVKFLEFIIPWLYLRCLHVVKMESAEILEVLSRCLRLEELTAEDLWTSAGKSFPQQVTLQNLRLLSLKPLTGDDGFSGVLDHLIAPSLLELKIRDSRPLDPKHSRSLHSPPRFLFQSSAYDNLHFLDLTFTSIPEQDLTDLLRVTPSLVTLHINLDRTIDHGPTVTGLLTCLSDVERVSPFLPQLRTLSCSGMSFMIDKLIIMLRARSESTYSWDGTSVNPLKDVRICMPCSLLHLPTTVWTVLDSLREGGMNITLDEDVMTS